jgi:hypothetical protein
VCDWLRHSTAHTRVLKACAYIYNARACPICPVPLAKQHMRWVSENALSHIRPTNIQTHTHHTLVLPCLFLKFGHFSAPNFGSVLYLAATWSGGAVEGLARFAAPSRCCQNPSEVRRARRGLCSRLRLQRLGAPSAACALEPQIKCEKRGPLLD